MLRRCLTFFGLCLLLSLSGCQSSPDSSERFCWSPFPVSQFESRFEYDELGYPILPKVTYPPGYEEAADRQCLIRLLEKNNRLLEQIADE